jgi:hypothetical protein
MAIQRTVARKPRPDDNLYSTLARIEQGTYCLSTDAALTSIAVSLKRIADAMEKQAGVPQPPVVIKP